MGLQPILPVKVSVTFSPMLNFDNKFHWYDDGDVTCEQTFYNELKSYLYYKLATRGRIYNELGHNEHLATTSKPSATVAAER